MKAHLELMSFVFPKKMILEYYITIILGIHSDFALLLLLLEETLLVTRYRLLLWLVINRFKKIQKNGGTNLVTHIYFMKMLGRQKINNYFTN